MENWCSGCDGDSYKVQPIEDEGLFFCDERCHENWLDKKKCAACKKLLPEKHLNRYYWNFWHKFCNFSCEHWWLEFWHPCGQ